MSIEISAPLWAWVFAIFGIIVLIRIIARRHNKGGFHR